MSERLVLVKMLRICNRNSFQKILLLSLNLVGILLIY